MSKPAAFHQICNSRAYPMYYHTHYTTKSEKGPATKRIAGLYYCPSCDTPTYAIDYRIPNPEDTKQKTLDNLKAMLDSGMDL